MVTACENDYYAAGCSELATETALTMKRLEPRQKLTKSATRTVIVLVGLPARGKSFVARKLQYYLNWTGVHCEIFNVGKYRREAVAAQQVADQETATAREQSGACDADFFAADNKAASDLREQVAQFALEDMLRWLDNEVESDSDDDTERLVPDISQHSSISVLSSCVPGEAKLNYKPHERIAIFDATNSTNKRRQWILEMCTCPERRQGKQTGLVFVESICDDEELLEENFRFKISNSPDFEGMPEEVALKDIRNRVAKYEAQYETIDDDALSYIKIFNLSTKLMVNHIYGRMAKDVVPALMAWHIGTRPIYLCRPGETISGISTDGEDYVNRKKINLLDPRFKNMSSKSKRQSLRGDTLGPSGQKFRQDLFNFCSEECQTFMNKRESICDLSHTGTSISGLAPCPSTHYHNFHGSMSELGPTEPFPLWIYTSTMPRAADTVNWKGFHINTRSNLNPLDKGDLAGMEMEELNTSHPLWYAKFEQDPYHTRFPGGESYRDLMSRLTSVVIDVEQQVTPTLIVSHVSIIQCLMAYFRNTRVEKCMEIEVPLHTVIKFTPVRGGGWSESHHPFYEVQTVTGEPGMQAVESLGELSQISGDQSNNSSRSLSSAPIWEDGMHGNSSSVEQKAT